MYIFIWQVWKKQKQETCPKAKKSNPLIGYIELYRLNPKWLRISRVAV